MDAKKKKKLREGRAKEEAQANQRNYAFLLKGKLVIVWDHAGKRKIKIYLFQCRKDFLFENTEGGGKVNTNPCACESLAERRNLFTGFFPWNISRYKKGRATAGRRGP